jgi:hypothetical protein
MNIKQSKIAVEERKLPPDSLDDRWGLLAGQLPFMMFVFTGLVIVINKNNPMNPRTEWVLLCFAIVLQLISIYFLATERELKRLSTGINKAENDRLIEDSLKELKWKYRKTKAHYLCEIPLIFGQTGFFMNVISEDNYIYYNIRNIGTGRGRMPFLFGLESLNAAKFRRKIQQRTTQYSSKVC